jgi:ketosteroid isomerase-like protein
MAGLAAVTQPPLANTKISDAEAQSAIDGFLDALFSGDLARISEVLGPEFQIMRSDGSSHDKASYLKALPNHKIRPVAIGLKVTGHDDVFVASYTVKSNQTIDGQTVEAISPRLSVFHKEGDRWLIVAHSNFGRIG